ncbi:MAG: hypothetical protein ABW007_20385 [Chitinophagaceae bacterium]
MSKSQKGKDAERSSGKPSGAGKNKGRTANRKNNQYKKEQDKSAEPVEERAKLSIQMDDKAVNGNVASAAEKQTVKPGDLTGGEGDEVYNEEEDDAEAHNAIDDDDSQENDEERAQRMRRKPRKNK